MTEDENAREIRRLVVANVRPPTIVPAGVRRTVGDQVIVLSHVEVWPWRVVLRGAIANEKAPPIDEPESASSGTSRPRDHPGDVGLHRWMTGWTAVDDVGTEYRPAGGGGGGSGGDLWMDFDVQIEPAPPVNAKRITLMGPYNVDLTIELPLPDGGID